MELMHLRWTALLALLLGVVSLGSCTNNSTAQPPPTPVITGLFPSSITAGSQMFNIFISGTGFVSKPQSLVFWNGSMRTSVLNSTTNQLVVTILPSDVATAGVGAVTVTNPEPGGPSLAATFVINPVQNGSPSISSLNPPSATPGSGAFTLTVNGSNFVAPVIANGVTQIAGSTVAWNSGPLPTTFVSASQITASVPANDIASPSFASVSVYNTTPGDTQVYSPAVDFEFTTNGSAFPKVASVNAAGGQADGASAAPAISGDGRFVAFFSQAKNLVALGAKGNVFVRDTCLGAVSCVEKTIAVDLAPDGGAPDAEAGRQVSLSTDGRFVVFESRATNLVPGQQSSPARKSHELNLFVRDLCTGANAPSGCTPHTESVSVSVSGELADAGESRSASASADGRFIAFASSAPHLVAEQTGSGFQIFVRDTCAGPSSAKACVARTEEIPLAAEVLASGAQGESPAISADGRYVTFMVWEAGSGPAGVRQPSQILLQDTCLGSNVPATCAPAPTVISVSSANRLGNAPSGSPSVSGDGRFVVFQSNASNLVAEAPKSKVNIFLRDTCLGPTASDGCAPSTTLIATEAAGVTANSDAFAPWISPSGRYLSFISGISASTKRRSSEETFLFVRDTCFGVTSACAARTVGVATPANSSPGTALNVAQFLSVPMIANGRLAAFSSTSPVPTAPTSGNGDVVLTLTSF
jgi:hypothetical protein